MYTYVYICIHVSMCLLKSCLDDGLVTASPARMQCTCDAHSIASTHRKQAIISVLAFPFRCYLHTPFPRVAVEGGRIFKGVPERCITR